MRNRKNKAAVFGVFTALALIFSYVELLIPVNFGIPGAKLGLANLVIVIVLYKTDWKEALLLSVVRIILAGFLFGNLFGILYSLAGRDPQSCSDGTAEKNRSFQCNRSQYGWRSQPQCGTTYYGNAGCRNLCCRLLSAGTVNCRPDYRHDDRHRRTGDAETA